MTATRPAAYELRVVGHLDRHWQARLGGLDLAHHADGTSTLSGAVADQAQLHGLLAALRDIGAPLLSLCRIDTMEHTTSDPGGGDPWWRRLDWPCRTARLSLRPGRPDDAAAVWRYRGQESVSRWLTAAPATFEAFREEFENTDRLARTIVVQREGDVVGDLMLKVEDGWSQAEVADRARDVQAELGWVLDPAFAGRGYATEAVQELLRICFEELGLRRVVANCFADNESSRRLMERLGMRRELHARQESLHRSGQWLDGYGYALLATEWRAGTDAGPHTEV